VKAVYPVCDSLMELFRKVGVASVKKELFYSQFDMIIF